MVRWLSDSRLDKQISNNTMSRSLSGIPRIKLESFGKMKLFVIGAGKGGPGKDAKIMVGNHSGEMDTSACNCSRSTFLIEPRIFRKKLTDLKAQRVDIKTRKRTRNSQHRCFCYKAHVEYTNHRG